MKTKRKKSLVPTPASGAVSTKCRMQKAKLLQVAMDRGYEVIGSSSGDANDGLIRHPDLREALLHIRTGAVDILMVTRTENLSHDDRCLCYVLKTVQGVHEKLLIPNVNLEKVLGRIWEKCV